MEINKLSDSLKDDLESLNLMECKIAHQWLTGRIRLLKQPHGKSVRELNLSKRAVTTLLNSKLLTVRDIEIFGMENIHILRGAGSKVLAEISQAMNK
ncbi:MAG: hypothetical protein ABI675_00040 [Chitinophagaceae bacterium]